MNDFDLCSKIWSEYESLVDYMTENDVYEIVKKNERFFNGRHWDGLSSSYFSKPTMNLLQRIGKYQIANLGSNDVGILIESLVGGEGLNENLKIVSKEVRRIIEVSKILEASRLAIRDGFVDGASYMMQSFDADYETGQDSKGTIINELLDMRRVLFGNPYSNNIQKQPYIIVVLRQYTNTVKEEAEKYGCKNIEDIKGDTDDNYDEDKGNRLCTVLIKFFRKKKIVEEVKTTIDENGQEVSYIEQKEIDTVHFVKVTKNAVIIPETDLGYSRYPIARFGWDNRKDSFLFDTPMTWNIENQVFINKMYSCIQSYIERNGIPKKLIDTTKVAMDDVNEEELGIAGLDILGKFMDFSKAPDFSNQVIAVIEKTETEMEKNMGVNDAALGNVKPENTSAIIALQDAAAVPLEIQRQNLKEMWEDVIRNIIDIMTTCYHERMLPDEDGNPVIVDFDQLKGINYNLNVDTGSSQQYSEIVAINNLSSLLNNGQIDLETFVELVPNKMLGGNKIPLKKFAQEQAKAQEQLANIQQNVQL